MTLIYCLIKDNTPFYVGKTRNPQSRFNTHKRQFNCEILILDEVDDSKWKFWEKHYISLFKSWGFKLENKNNGGGGIRNFKMGYDTNFNFTFGDFGALNNNTKAWQPQLTIGYSSGYVGIGTSTARSHLEVAVMYS